MSKNILIIGDNEGIVTGLISKPVLLRENDHILSCQYKDVNNILTKYNNNVIILCNESDNKQSIKYIENLKKNFPENEIILYSENADSEYILEAFDKGIYDYISPNSEKQEITIKILNCFKYMELKELNNQKELLLENSGIISIKTGLYQFKYIKDVLDELIQQPQTRNGIFVILKLDDEIKTKVSMNRLNILTKKATRKTDIISASADKIYIILQNTTLHGAKTVIEKLQDLMGKEFKLHAGFSKIDFDDYETIIKNATDSLKSAINNDELCSCLTDKYEVEQDWLEAEHTNIKKTKQFKLFNNAFHAKLKDVIEPCFYRCQKNLESKKLYKINQYCNKIECVFSIKKDDIHSELVIHYDGYTKLNIEIIHYGLDRAENTQYKIPVNKLTDKELTKLLKKLKQEF